MSEFRSDLVRFRYDFTNALLLAFDSIRSHKLRSFLTLLGVIIGVASVILVGSGIEGLGAYAEASTAKAFGSKSYFVAQVASAGRLTRKQFFEKMRQNRQVSLADDRYLEATVGEDNLYSPYRQQLADIKRDSFAAEDSSILGCSFTLPDIRDITLVDGRFFTDQEERSRSYVAVIGDETRTMLFPDGSSPVGRNVKINGIDFRVVGVQEKLGSAFGRSQDRSAYIPITAFDRMYGPSYSISVFGAPKPGSHLTFEQSLDETRVALRTRYHAKPGKPDNFDILTPDAIRGFIDTMLALITAVVVPVTCISLLVGGIVIMNIMLVSVTERTREIGIRKSLGARRSDIMLQILIEAVLLACVGGAAGVALGAAATALVSRLFGLSMEITATYVALSLFVSSVVGIASGWYPASRAAKLDPIVALRSE